MAESETALVNRALMLLGQTTISSLEDATQEARTANRLYSQVRDDVLSAHNWNCATARTTLSKSDTAPAWGYSSKYALPADFIKLISLQDMRDEFRIEGAFLLTDDGDGKIRYIFRLTDVSKMEDNLKAAIAYRLAAELAVVLKGSMGDHQAMMNEYRVVLAESRLNDAQQGPTDRFESSTWVDARTGSELPFRAIEST